MSFFNILWTISNTIIGLYFKFTKFVSGYKTHIKMRNNGIMHGRRNRGIGQS